MKFTLLAAAALLAAPAIAQQTGTPAGDPSATQGTPAPDATASDPAMQQTTPPADASAMPADPATTAPPAQGSTMSTQSTGDAATAGGQMGAAGGAPAQTAGGYAPASAGSAQPLAAGQTAQIQQQPTPDQAFPPPAAKSSYPVCKAGQYDGCMQRSSGGGSRARARRR